MRSVSIPLTIAAFALASSAATANVICQPTEKLQELVANTDAKPVFMAQSADPDISFLIVGDANTGEWISFAITKKGGKACNVANGFNFSIVAPKTEPAK